MASPNTLIDLNDHLFCQMERLNDDCLTEEELKNEVGRARAMAQVAREIVNNAQTMLNAQKFLNNNDFASQKSSRILIGEDKSF